MKKKFKWQTAKTFHYRITNDSWLKILAEVGEPHCMESSSFSSSHNIHSACPTGSSAQALKEHTAFPHSCQANHLMASKTAHKGELWFQVLAGKSPKEQAIIYLITLTIPLWKSILVSPMNSCSGAASKGAGSLWWNTLGRAIVSTEAGTAHICEK